MKMLKRQINTEIPVFLAFKMEIFSAGSFFCEDLQQMRLLRRWEAHTQPTFQAGGSPTHPRKTHTHIPLKPTQCRI